VVGGVCGDDSRCVCPLPRSGSACQRQLSCRWLDASVDVWQQAGCALYEARSSAQEVACVCTSLYKSVTAMHQLTLKSKCSSGGSLINCAVPQVRLEDLASISFNGELTVLLVA